MLKIKSITADPYASTIESFLSQCLPAFIDSNEAMIDALTSAFLTTNQNRYGPMPPPETVVAIRDVLRYWTERDEPIAVLSPWGSRKAGDGRIDVAEIMALRQLEALNNRVKKYYQPGVTINLGIEDLGGYYLWSNETNPWQESGEKYVRDMVDIVNILGMRSFIDPVPESELVVCGRFYEAADQFFDPLKAYLLGKSSIQSMGRLFELGWIGDLPNEMVDWYLNQYGTLYSDLDYLGRKEMLARYLAQSAARYKVGAKLRHPEWNRNFVQVNFPQPVPGVPEALGGRRLFYRTLPMRMARTHMPPWRAKGFLCIRENEATVKLATIREEREYNRVTLEFYNEETSVEVDSDYVLQP